MDTPGLFDTDTSPEKTGIILVKAVVSMHPGFDCVVYVIRLGVKYTEEEFAAYQRFKMLFGSDVTNHMLLIFTGGDTLKPGTNVDEKLKRSPKKLRDVLDDCNWRYVVFNNMTANEEEQLRQLIQQVKDISAINGGRPYVCTNYSKIGETLEEQVGKRVKEIEIQEARAKKYFQDMEQELLKQLDEMHLSREMYEDEMVAAYAQMEEEKQWLMKEWELSMKQLQEEEERKRLQLEEMHLSRETSEDEKLEAFEQVKEAMKSLRLAEEEQRRRHELEARLLREQTSSRRSHQVEAAIGLFGTALKATTDLVIAFAKK